MLRVARIGDRTGRYYLADLATELDAATISPGSERERHGGRWLCAGGLGLRQGDEVTAAQLGAVLSGKHPTTGHRLRARETRTSGFDLVLAAPKSVSVLFGLGEPEVAAAVRGAHEAAVDEAMDYVAAHAVAVRATTPEGRVPISVDGVVAASFTHGVSRALDPHLHSHVVVANLAHGNDGRWRALDGRGLYAHARAAGALYDAALRHGITERVGLGWTAETSSTMAPRRWELEGIDPVTLGAFSGRRAEILGRAHRHGARPGQLSPSARAKTVACAATREQKDPRRSAEELRARWAAVARDTGWCPSLLRGAHDGRTPGVEQHAVDEHRLAGEIFERRGRGVARRDFVAAWAGAIAGGARAGDVARCVDLVADWGTGVGVAERCLPPGSVAPPAYLLRLLGPRPASPERLRVWRSAATTIEDYRGRWEVRDPWEVLGAQTRAELSAFPARRLAEHLTTSREIDDALMRLGRRRDRDRQRARVLEPDLGLSPS